MTAAVSVAQGGVNNVTMRNRIINGGMVIDQRSAGAAVTPSSAGQYSYPCLDRWKVYVDAASKLTFQQNAGSVTPPAGFKNYMGVTVASAYSPASSDAFGLMQNIEGFNTSDLNWGTASALSVTLSFWVRSSLTGTFGGFLRNNAQNRLYAYTYTISAANTWEQKTITIAGDQSGTWTTDNTVGLAVEFDLGTGSAQKTTANTWLASNLWGATGTVNLVATAGATFYITGVQLEAGTTATPFEQRLYGTELALCQRYCLAYRYADSTYVANAASMLNTTQALAFFPFPVTTRVAPTGITVTSASNFVGNGTSSNLTLSSITFNAAGLTWGRVTLTGTGGTSGQPLFLQANNSSAYLEFTGMEL